MSEHAGVQIGQAGGQADQAPQFDCRCGTLTACQPAHPPPGMVMNASAASNIIALRSCMEVTTRISPTVVPEICRAVDAHSGWAGRGRKVEKVWVR